MISDRLFGRRILVIAAHPDDDILGCGGTLLKAARDGADIRVVFLAEGSSCRFDGDKIRSPEALAAIAQRTSMAMAALNHLGITDCVFHDLPCGRLDGVPMIELGKIVERHVQSFKPDCLLTHSEIDANLDHRLCLQAVLQATRPGSACSVPTVMSFEIPSSTEWRFVESFRPTLFVDIEGEIDDKLKAFNFYDSEMRAFPFPRSDQGLRAIASVRGMQAGKKYAEAFQIVRAILS
jgi:LmbE family N-acetylglucosaminyl deacetylase